MSVWIIGATGSGKSTLAKRLSRETGMPVLETGLFCRAMCRSDASAEALAKIAVAALAKDYRHFSRKIATALEGRIRHVVVGARNPVDFIDSFSPKQDIVISLSAGKAKTPFEYHGIAAITRIIHFWLAAEIIKSAQYQMLDADKTQEDWYATFRLKL